MNNLVIFHVSDSIIQFYGLVGIPVHNHAKRITIEFGKPYILLEINNDDVMNHIRIFENGISYSVSFSKISIITYKVI